MHLMFCRWYLTLLLTAFLLQRSAAAGPKETLAHHPDPCRSAATAPQQSSSDPASWPCFLVGDTVHRLEPEVLEQLPALKALVDPRYAQANPGRPQVLNIHPRHFDAILHFLRHRGIYWGSSAERRQLCDVADLLGASTVIEALGGWSTDADEIDGASEYQAADAALWLCYETFTEDGEEWLRYHFVRAADGCKVGARLFSARALGRTQRGLYPHGREQVKLALQLLRFNLDTMNSFPGVCRAPDHKEQGCAWAVYQIFPSSFFCTSFHR